MKVFWDTNLFIYLWENSVLTNKALQLAEQLSDEGAALCTSSLTLGEILVKPFSEERLEEVENYVRWFQEIEVVSFGQREAITFARFRGQFPAIKPPDAIQLSCALSAGAKQFITNDNRLSRLPLDEMAISSLEDAFKR